MDLDGWSIGDGKVRVTFPLGACLAPGGSANVARSAPGLRAVMDLGPGFAWIPGGSNRESTQGPPLVTGTLTGQGDHDGMVTRGDGLRMPSDHTSSLCTANIRAFGLQ